MKSFGILFKKCDLVKKSHCFVETVIDRCPIEYKRLTFSKEDPYKINFLKLKTLLNFETCLTFLYIFHIYIIIYKISKNH